MDKQYEMGVTLERIYHDMRLEEIISEIQIQLSPVFRIIAIQV